MQQLQLQDIITDLDFLKTMNWQWTTNQNETVVKIKMNKHEELYYVKSEISKCYKQVEYSNEQCDYGFIGRIHRNGVIRILFKTKFKGKIDISQDSQEDEYKLINIEICRVIAKGTVVAYSNTSVDKEFMDTYQVIVNQENIYREKKLISSEEWEERKVIEAEAVSLHDLVKTIKRNTESMNSILITINNNNNRKLMRALSSTIEKAM